MFRDDPFGGTAAHTLPLTPLNVDEQLTLCLRDHLQRLRLILPVISVSVLALRSQNAELDEDIASVLHRSAVDPLGVEIENIEALVESVVLARRTQEVAA